MQGRAQDFTFFLMILMCEEAHISFDEEGMGEKSVLNSAENEILYNIVTATERGDRGECPIV